jgi:hypothetical protein
MCSWNIGDCYGTESNTTSVQRAVATCKSLSSKEQISMQLSDVHVKRNTNITA